VRVGDQPWRSVTPGAQVDLELPLDEGERAVVLEARWGAWSARRATLVRCAPLREASRPPPPAEIPSFLSYDPELRLFRNTRDGSLLFWVPPAPGAAPRSGVFMGVHAVSRDRYLRFARAVGREVTGSKEPSPEPVVDVSWYDASAYCRWAGGRLPSQQDWDRAAKGLRPSQAGRGQQLSPRRRRAREWVQDWLDPPPPSGTRRKVFRRTRASASQGDLGTLVGAQPESEDPYHLDGETGFRLCVPLEPAPTPSADLDLLYPSLRQPGLYVISDSITIRSGEVATIPAGALVEFEPGGRILVHGELEGRGDPSAPIQLRQRQSASAPPLELDGGTLALRHCRLLGLSGGPVEALRAINEARVDLADSIFVRCSSTALLLQDSNAKLRRVSFEECSHPQRVGGAIQAIRARLELSECSFSGPAGFADITTKGSELVGLVAGPRPVVKQQR